MSPGFPIRSEIHEQRCSKLDDRARNAGSREFHSFCSFYSRICSFDFRQCVDALYLDADDIHDTSTCSNVWTFLGHRERDSRRAIELGPANERRGGATGQDHDAKNRARERAMPERAEGSRVTRRERAALLG